MSGSGTERRRPKVFATVWRAWRSTALAVLQMPLAFFLTAAATVLLSSLTFFIDLQWPRAPQGDVTSVDPAIFLFRTVLPLLAGDVVRAFTTAPLAIAVHRFVVLGERSIVLPILPLRRLLRFAGFLVAINIIIELPTLLSFAALPYKAFIVAFGQIAGGVLFTRLLLVFPAVAVGSPDKQVPSHGWNETRWQYWRISTIVSLSIFPVSLAVGFYVFLTWRGSIVATLHAWPILVLASAFDPFFIALGAAAASWLFIGYGVKRLALHNSYSEAA